MYVNKAKCNDCNGGTWTQLNLTKYIINGMICGMGLYLVIHKCNIDNKTIPF